MADALTAAERLGIMARTMYDYGKITLPNRLRIVFLEMPHVHSVVAAVYVGAGSRYETEGRLGISHLLEHMLFRASDRYPTSVDLLRAVDDIGGEADAYTSPEYCAYLLRAHRRRAEQAVDLLAEIVLSLKLKKEHLETEKSVVREEITQYRDPGGDFVSIDDLAYNLMWKTTSLDHCSFGDENTIDSITAEDLRRHYEEHYVPTNIVVCVSGHFDRGEIEAQVAERFGGLQGEHMAPPPAIERDQSGPQAVFRRIHSSSTHFKLCHKAYSYRDPKLTSMLLISDVLGGTTSSRLLSTVREQHGLAYDISATPNLFSDVGSVDVYAVTSRANLVHTVHAVMEEIERLHDEGITPEELRRTEERVFTQMEMILDSPLDLSNWFGIEELLITPDQPDTPEKQAEKVRNTSLDEVRDTIAEVFVPHRRNFASVGPTSWWQRRRIRKQLR